MKKILQDCLLFLVFSILIHALYMLLPNIITIIFTPVNKSLIEQFKLIFSSYLTLFVFKSLFFKTNEEKDFTIYFFSILTNITILFLIYLPFLFFKANIFIYIVIYIISNILTFTLIYKIKNKLISKNYKKPIIISSIILIIMFTYFSYYPLKSFLFYDRINNRYGIHTYP